MSASKSRPSARWLHALAFASGVAALAYEVSWTRLLSLTFGGGILAASTTVAAFMGGMGLGAWLYHRAAARVRSPLRLYAAIELAIALTAALLTPALAELPPLFAAIAADVPDGALMTTLRIGSVFLLLLVPTSLMGATYPALCDAAIVNREGLDLHLGALYGWNTVGAAFGALLAGVALIPQIGLNSTVAVGVFVNASIAAAAFALAGRGAPAAREEVAEQPAGVESALPRALLGAVLALSGFATLAYEIVWFRALRYLIGNSTFAFAIVLMVFLLGLGFGALGLRRALERGRVERTLVLVQLAIALFAALAIGVEAHIVDSAFGYSISAFNPGFRSNPWELRLAIHGGVALALMLPATLLMGLSFPLASRLFIGDVGQLGRRVGLATLLANFGGIAGSIGAAVWLLPSLGSTGATRALVGLNLGLGLVLLLALRGARPWRTALAIVVLTLLATRWLPSRIGFMGGALGTTKARLIFEEEGSLATVQVREALGHPEHRGITIDGATIGVSSGWSYDVYSKQLLVAHLPLVLEPRIRSVTQIGLGSASTLDALTGHPRLERIHAVEISSAVVRGSRFFEESRALEDPRVELFVEDALHHLLRRTEEIDLIVADGKQNDDFSGNAKMLSREFYQLALERLSDYGLFVQWLGVTMHDESFPIVLRTAAEVFPHLDVFYDFPTSVLLVGSRTGLGGREAMSAEDFAGSRAFRDLRNLGVGGQQPLRWGWIADRGSLLQVLGAGPSNDWNHAVVDFLAYRADHSRPRRSAQQNLALLLEANAVARAPEGFAPPDARRQQAIRWVREAYRELFGGDVERARSLAERALEAAPEDPIPRRAHHRLGGVAQ